MSDVEKLYYALAPKFGNTLKWHELNFMEQQAFVQGINMLLSVLIPQGQGNEDNLS